MIQFCFAVSWYTRQTPFECRSKTELAARQAVGVLAAIVCYFDKVEWWGLAMSPVYCVGRSALMPRVVRFHWSYRGVDMMVRNAIMVGIIGNIHDQLLTKFYQKHARSRTRQTYHIGRQQPIRVGKNCTTHSTNYVYNKHDRLTTKQNSMTIYWQLCSNIQPRYKACLRSSLCYSLLITKGSIMQCDDNHRFTSVSAFVIFLFFKLFTGTLGFSANSLMLHYLVSQSLGTLGLTCLEIFIVLSVTWWKWNHDRQLALELVMSWFRATSITRSTE